MSSARRAAALAAVGLFLVLPASARANGDPASDYLLVRDTFLPLTAGINQDAVKRLDETIKAADKSGYKIRAAMILRPSDLGTAFSLFRKPQRYAQFLGFELAFVYPGRLLVVMPNGYGYAVKGKPDAKASRVVSRMPPPGADATKEVQAATLAIQRLAAANGHHLEVSSGGGSETKDRITIAAAATAGIAVIAAIALYRRQRKRTSTGAT
jgi:hypothetical protein